MRKDDRAKTAMQKDLLLHSTSHPRLDYTAKQDVAKGSKSSLNHYLGVYDPATGKLQLVEAKKMNISATVRARQSKADKDDDVKQVCGHAVLHPALAARSVDRAVLTLCC
jgi:hypothetical protein